MGSLSYALWIMAKLLYSCLCLFYAIIESHVIDEKMFNDFLIGKWKWILLVIKAYLIHDFHIIYVLEVFIILN